MKSSWGLRFDTRSSQTKNNLPYKRLEQTEPSDFIVNEFNDTVSKKSELNYDSGENSDSEEGCFQNMVNKNVAITTMDFQSYEVISIKNISNYN